MRLAIIGGEIATIWPDDRQRLPHNGVELIRPREICRHRQADRSCVRGDARARDKNLVLSLIEIRFDEPIQGEADGLIFAPGLGPPVAPTDCVSGMKCRYRRVFETRTSPSGHLVSSAAYTRVVARRRCRRSGRIVVVVESVFSDCLTRAQDGGRRQYQREKQTGRGG